MSEIICLHDRIMCELPKLGETTTEAGVIIPEDVNEELQKEKVTSEGEKLKATATFVGPDVKDVKIGDELEIDNHHVPVITIDGRRFGVVREYNVICIIRD